MDRVISLLAALVGLIALGGAILVHTNADAQRAEIAGEIAQLKLSVGLINQQQNPGATPPSTEPVAAADVSSDPSSSAEPAAQSPVSSALSTEPFLQFPPSASAGGSQAPATADAGGTDMKQLLDRIAQLEQTTKDQASQLDEARMKLSALPSQVPTDQVAALSEPSQSANPTALAADGPTSDCIPLGTRFMGAAGDKFPICKTKLVVKVASVTEGLATINGAGDIAAGAFGALDKSCSIMVFSADPSGYAEMRVTCQ